MKNNGVLSERKNEFRVQSEKDLKKVNKYLEEQLKDTIKNLKLLGVIEPEVDIEDLKNKYNNVGELKIEIKITHQV